MITLKDWIKKCEGYNSHPYPDTAAKLTIGWGRNLDITGISLDEAELMLDNDIATAIKDLNPLSWYSIQPPNTKEALVNMCFNLGIARLLQFKDLITALEQRNYALAAREVLDSKWAEQVGQRAKDVALMIRESKS